MKPTFNINNHEYSPYIAELQAERNDLDASGSGRSVLDGYMYRSRLAQKEKWAVKFEKLSEQIMKRLAEDVNGTYTSVTLLNPKTNQVVTKTYYISTLVYGAQQYDPYQGISYYYGVGFNMVER